MDSSSSSSGDSTLWSHQRIVTLTRDDVVLQHTVDGSFVGEASVGCVGAKTTAWACSPCAPVLVTGTSRGVLKTFRLEEDGGCALVCRRTVHSEAIAFLGVDATGTHVLSASTRHFVILSVRGPVQEEWRVGGGE